jgi:hypothetical protein
MIRLTWLQFRMQAAVAAGALVLIAVALALTGPHLAHLYDTSGISLCQAQSNCASLASRFLSEARAAFIDKMLLGFGGVMVAAPALVGIFWGAPLIARELETGTYRLAWTQTVTPQRWLAVKLGIVGVASVAAVGLLSLMLTWWSRSTDLASMNLLTPAVFGERGIAPAGYAAFAFVVGLAAGLLLRRTLPAMAITLAGFAAVRLAITYWVRPHLVTPAHTTAKVVESLPSGALRLWPTIGPHGPVGVPVTIPASAWIYSNQRVNAAGQAVGSGLSAACQRSQAAIEACTAGFHRLVTYQPASRFWEFQWRETAIFVALALILAGLCFMWLRRRRS